MRSPVFLTALLTIISGLGPPTRAADEAAPIDVILVAGQSNAVGYDAKPDLLPPDDGDKEVLFWFRCGDPPPDEFDVASGGKWTHLQPQPRGTPNPDKKIPRQYGNFAQAQGGFGPEIGIARTWRKSQRGKLAIIKAAFSGTNLASDWHPERGPCYKTLVDETKAALAAAEAKQLKLRLRAFTWVQGESDANPTDAPQYERRLTEMLTALRRDLAAPEMTVLLAVNTRFGGGKNTFMPQIVAAQKAVAEKLPKCAYVDTADCTIANGAHFDTPGTLDVGRRFAESLLKGTSDALGSSGR